MRIDKFNNEIQIYNKNNQVKQPKENKVIKEDQVSISKEAKELQFALSKLKDVEEVRTEKVERLKEQVKAGTYKVDGEKIAKKILEDIGFDKRI